MIKKVAVALVLGATVLSGLVACGDARDEVSGTVVDKEYEPRNCERRSGRTCKKWDPAEHELKIKQADGSEVKLVVSKSTYDSAREGDRGTWKGWID